MKTALKFDSQNLSRLTGVVRDLHAKSSDSWSRARVELIDGSLVWVVAKFGLSIGETLCADCEYDSKFKSYTVKNLITNEGGKISNSVIALKLIENLQGVGKVRAAKLCESYENLFEALTNTPDEVAKLVGIPVEHVIEVADQLKLDSNVLNRLTELEKYGWPNALAKRVAKSDELYEVASKNPYAAIKLVVGLGWKTADTIGRNKGIKSNDKERLKAAVDYFYNDFVDDEGNTKVTLEDLTEYTEGLPSIVGHDVTEEEILESISENLIKLDDGWFTSEKHYRNTETIVSFFAPSKLLKKFS